MLTIYKWSLITGYKKKHFILTCIFSHENPPQLMEKWTSHFGKSLFFAKLPALACLSPRSVLKCSGCDGNAILTCTPVSLTTLKLLSHTISFFAVTLVVLPAFSFQQCTPLIVVEVPLLARRLLNCYSTLAPFLRRKNKFYSFQSQKFTRNG